VFVGDTKDGYPKPDGKYTFDKLSSVYITGNATRDDAPAAAPPPGIARGRALVLLRAGVAARHSGGRTAAPAHSERRRARLSSR
jgi:hypothetical protein